MRQGVLLTLNTKCYKHEPIFYLIVLFAMNVQCSIMGSCFVFTYFDAQCNSLSVCRPLQMQSNEKATCQCILVGHSQ